MRAGTRNGTRWRGLDGLRALAVIAVVIYHFSPDTLSGGFFGVDIFFGISGYLITRLLVEEFLRTGRIDLARFYRRRARRLLPALALLLGAVATAALIWRDQLATVRGGTLATAVFGANWWLVFDHQSYFVATGRPSMLQHLWSLGVEEQFYLVWPVVAAGCLAAGRRAAIRKNRGRDEVVARLVVLAMTLAVASTALMWWLGDRHNVPYGSYGSILYVSTETHCMGLLLGAAFGARAAARVPSETGGPSWLTPAFDVAALLALAGLGWLMVGIADYSRSLYRGDFFLVGALVVVVISAVTRPGSRVGLVLDIRPMRWVGLRSYGIYLWHWPVAVVTRPGVDTTLPVWIDQLLRITVTLLLAAVSYRYLESPVRRFGLAGTVSRYRRALRVQWRRLPPRASVVASVATVTVMVIGALVIVIGPAAPTSKAAAGAGVGGRDLKLTGHPSPDPTPMVTESGSGPALPQAPLPKISGYGDSVLLGARSALSQVFPGGSIDAVEGRQPDPILADVIADAHKGKVQPFVVIQVGNNGLIEPSELEAALSSLTSAQLVLVVNNHLESSDHSWQKPNNATIARVVPEFANARILDWATIAAKHRSWLYNDDLHLTPSGATAYAHLLAATYRSYVSS